MRIFRSERESLALAAEAVVGPSLPAPPMFADTVAGLLDKGLLAETDGRVTITDAGREALRLDVETRGHDQSVKAP